ncbi:MAG: TonB-dependent receptor [candidate division KSB1 bacterium]|nr:TonB-dependent receptor [candidate division KSB1 bacterium]
MFNCSGVPLFTALLIFFLANDCFSQENQARSAQQDTTISPKVLVGKEAPLASDTLTFSQDTTKVVTPPPKGHPKARTVISLKSSLMTDSLLCGQLAWTLKREEIDKLLYRDFGDIVKHIPGIILHDLGSTGQVSRIHLRGSSPEQVLFLLNGRPLNNSQSEAFDLNLMPVTCIERVELITSPTCYPFGAIGGLINVVTQAYKSEKPYSRVIYRKGDHGYSDVDVTFAQRISHKMDLNLGSIWKNFGGQFPYSHYEAQTIRTQLNCQYNPGWQLSYFLLYNKNDVDIPWPISNTQLTTPYAHQKVVRYDHSLTLRANFMGDPKEDLRAYIYHTSSYREFRDFPNNWDGLYRNRFTGIEAEFYHSFKRQQFTLGGNFEYRWLRSNELRNQGNLWGMAFVRDMIDLGKRCRLQLLATGEKHQFYDFGFSPNIEITLNPHPKVSLAVSWGQARRYPNFYELNAHFADNPNLKPERGQNWEASLSYHSQDWVRIKWAIFYRKVWDRIEDSDSSKTNFTNKGRGRYHGVELDLAIKSGKKFTPGFTLSFLRTRDEVGRSFPDLPEINGYGYLDVYQNFFEDDLKVCLRLSGRLIGKRWGMNKLFTETYVRLPTTGILDLKGLFTVKTVQIFLALENILNQEYEQVYGYPMPGRRLSWGITWPFWD